MAAGRGSRLEHLTDDKPKAFLEVKGHKLIEYNIALLHHFDIKKITIVTGYKNEKFEDFTKNIEGVQCVYNPFWEMMNVLGSFYMGEHTLSNEDTIYMHADTLCAPEILEKAINCEGDFVLPTEIKQCDEEAMKVEIKNGEVVRISKEIPLDSAVGEFIGIAKFSGNIMTEVKASVKTILKNGMFKSYFEGAIQHLINQHKYNIIAIPTERYFWGEVDFKEDYEQVIKKLPDNLYKLVK